MDEYLRRNGCAYLLTILCTKLSLLCVPASAIADSRFSILYHEPIVLLGETFTSKEPLAHDVAEALRFDAFGRRFEVQLELPARPNNRQQISGIKLFAGHLKAAPGSWVRLMRHGDRLSGIIHDVSDTYFIEPRSIVSEALVDAGQPADSINVIYRLADTLVAAGLLSCSTQVSSEPINGQVAATKLAAELTAAHTTTPAAHIPTARIGIIADIDFFARFGSNSASEIESLFNIVDGLFTEQIGVEIRVAESLIISSQDQNPFSATTIGGELLDELSNWRRMNQADLSLTHLVTNRRLTGENPGNFIAGLSFRGIPGRAGVCFAQTGASMSAWFGNLTALIITHEIAHNFGAPHDGELADNPLPANPCASTPPSGFLMGASLSSAATDRFSQCSLREMRKVVDAANCLESSAPSTPAADENGGGGTLNWVTVAALFVIVIFRRKSRDLSTKQRVAI
jgi:hypothetical protein